MTTLPAHIRRCLGDGSFENGKQQWREGCEDCLRRTAPWAGLPGSGFTMKPPPIIAFECEHRIGPGDWPPAQPRPQPERENCLQKD